ncbi:hypothetical protein PTKIN_Ptkin18bG0094400 [Pterospermum kingtungense]
MRHLLPRRLPRPSPRLLLLCHFPRLRPPPSVSFPSNLVLLKSFRSHKKSINDLAVHPIGTLAFSVSRDGCFAISNLRIGKRTFCERLLKEATIVKFDGSGEKFFFVTGGKVGVHLADYAKLLLVLEHEKRVLCVAPGESGILFSGGESRSITAWDTNSGKVAYRIDGAHFSRVKGIVVLSKDGGGDDDPYLVASASSDGFIRVRYARMATEGKPNPLAEVNTKSRLTCLAGSYLKSSKQPQIGKSAPEEDQEVSSTMCLITSVDVRPCRSN